MKSNKQFPHICSLLGWQRGGDGFRYPILIPVKKIHPHTQTQRV